MIYVASVYFLWRERYMRLFQGIKRDWVMLWRIIEQNVKLKLANLKVIQSNDVDEVFNIWGIEKKDG